MKMPVLDAHAVCIEYTLGVPRRHDAVESELQAFQCTHYNNETGVVLMLRF